MSTSPTAVVALLADGRFPTGGHAHSGGYEAAAGELGLDSIADLDAYVRGRLSTAGRVDATIVAATVTACQSVPTDPAAAVDSAAVVDLGAAVDWVMLDAEAGARIASPTLREVSRSLGRQWLRAGRRIWPDPRLAEAARTVPGGLHQPVAIGAVAAAAGLDPRSGAVVALHHLVAGVATAAIRLHGLDPYEVQRTQLALVPLVERLADDALAAASLPPADWPATTGPVAELLAERHARWDVRMFRS